MERGLLREQFLKYCSPWLKVKNGFSVRGAMGIYSSAVVLWLGVNQRLTGCSLRDSLLSLVADVNQENIFPLVNRVNKKLRAKNISFNTGGISRARNRISEEDVMELFNSASDLMYKDLQASKKSFRKVYVIDGQNIAIARTKDNLSGFCPTYCGNEELHYPRIRTVSLHDPSSGLARRLAIGDIKSSEVGLAMEMLGDIEKGSLIIGDRGYDKPVFLDYVQKLGINILVRLKNSKGKDLLGSCKEPYAEKKVEWFAKTATGKKVTLRGKVIKFTGQSNGFRSQEFYFFTNDDNIGIEEAGNFYRQRVRVELFIREIKQTLNLFFIHAKTAANVKKEIILAYLTFNLVRSVMQNTANHTGVPVEFFSFKATIKLCVKYANSFQNARTKQEREFYLSRFRANMLQAKLPKREKQRSYPRVIKLPRDRYETAGVVRKSHGCQI